MHGESYKLGLTDSTLSDGSFWLKSVQHCQELCLLADGCVAWSAYSGLNDSSDMYNGCFGINNTPINNTYGTGVIGGIRTNCAGKGRC